MGYNKLREAYTDLPTFLAEATNLPRDTQDSTSVSTTPTPDIEEVRSIMSQMRKDLRVELVSTPYGFIAHILQE